MIVTLIAAVSEDGFISRGKGVPWDLPDDRAHFRARTQGRWLLVGRHTYEEMTGWFRPGHKPLVLSRDPAFVPAIGSRVASVAEALATVAAAGESELMVIGGGGVFSAAMPLATRLDLTRVHERLGDGVPFPRIESRRWHKVSSQRHPADAAHAFAFTFSIWERTV